MEQVPLPKDYQPFGLDNGYMTKLHLISKVLKQYLAAGKTKEEFAEEFGCDFVLDESNYGIRDIRFHNDSNETMFMLKYNK